jgi:hypothetical protein
MVFTTANVLALLSLIVAICTFMWLIYKIWIRIGSFPESPRKLQLLHLIPRDLLALPADEENIRSTQNDQESTYPLEDNGENTNPAPVEEGYEMDILPSPRH